MLQQMLKFQQDRKSKFYYDDDDVEETIRAESAQNI